MTATQLYAIRLRNFKDLEAIVEELSAVADKKKLLDIYRTATSEPFIFCLLTL